MMNSLYVYISLLVYRGIFLISVKTGQANGHCDMNKFPKAAQFLNICEDNHASGNRIYLDSTSAPRNRTVSCECIFKHNQTMQLVQVYIEMFIESNRTPGVNFDIGGHVFRSESSTPTTILNLTSQTMIMLRQQAIVQRPDTCFGIYTVNPKDTFTIECRANRSTSSTEGDGMTIGVVVTVVTVCIVLIVIVVGLIIIRKRREKRSRPPAIQQAHVPSEARSVQNATYTYKLANVNSSSSTAPASTEQQGLLGADSINLHKEAYCEVVDAQAPQHDVGPQVDSEKTSAFGKTCQIGKHNALVCINKTGTENVYRDTGGSTIKNRFFTDNVYDTCVAEDEYNHLQEVVGPPKNSNNEYGDASGVTNKA